MHDLWESQKQWVLSYATACGVPPDQPPPIPVPASVKECFKRAGEARVTYIRSYGQRAGGIPATSSLQEPSSQIGPSFDCSKAVRPLTLLICADPGLSRLDLRFNQAYWALYQQVGTDGQSELKRDDNEFIARVPEQCGLPQSGGLTAEVWQARDCVEIAYDRKRQAWLARLTGAAYQEAVRPLELAIALQRDLQRLGFAPASLVGGVYSPAMRAGIETWQSARGLPMTGLLGDTDARALEQEASSASVPNLGSAREQEEEEPNEAVAMQRAGETYAVPVRINGAITLRFIVDSGAADVLIPADVVLTLARAGTIAPGDFIGDQTYTLGDGSTVKSARFVLRELQVGDQVIRNVIAGLGSVNSVPLLGQSFLSRFTSWTLDNERHALVLGQQRQVSNEN
ncbi:MAG TPA: retroviral-like aspartic protease family protein [Stellaceae bacterium]|nr:retroviral-like aspartic protease family protein [Stellaceae bacterium]